MVDNLTIEEYQKLQPRVIVEFEGQKIAYSTPNKKTVWRVQTLMTKEPETIEWISTFQPGDVLVDVGANVGMYTIWAARTRGVRVFAFEPEAQNYALLNNNIQINGLTERVTAYCAALSDEVKFDKLNLRSGEAGDSCHSFGESVDFRLRPCRYPLSQGAVAVTLDGLVEQQVIPPPTHIKIDVDGFEHKVIRGAEKTLQNPAARSVLVETNTNLQEHRNIIDRMQEYGFDYSEDQVRRHIVTQGTFAGVCNYIFQRKSASHVPGIHRLQPGGRIVSAAQAKAG